MRFKHAKALIVATTAFLASTTLSAAPPPQGARQYVSGQLLVKFKNDVAPNSAREGSALSGTGTSVLARMPEIGVTIVRTPANSREADHLARLKARAEVEFAEFDEIVAPAEVIPNDPMFSYAQWALQRIECPAAWSSTTSSPNVIIAVLDTGVNATHPDLLEKVVPGWNMYDNNSNTIDLNGHGTSVAGTAAGASNNAEGIASVAWGARIMPIRVTNNSGNATFSMIANGLTWARSRGARVANISYGVTNSSTVRTAAQAFQNAGGVVVIAAGNNGYLDTTADNAYALTVSATDSNDVVPPWSNTGNNVDLSAPGVSIYCTSVNGGYASGTGTSFSAPLVSGVAALVISANPALTGAQVQEVIKHSALDLGPVGWDPRYGSGRLNAAAAVAAAVTGVPPPQQPPAGDTTAPTITITSPASGGNVQGQVNVAVAYSDNVAVTRVELFVDGLLKASKTSAPFTTRWNSNQASAGAHALFVKAYDATGNIGVSPTVTVYR